MDCFNNLKAEVVVEITSGETVVVVVVVDGRAVVLSSKTTFNDGYLGLVIDEGRSEVR